MKVNKPRKRSIVEAIMNLEIRKRNYNREYELQMKRNYLKGAELMPSQDVFKEMRKGQS